MTSSTTQWPELFDTRGAKRWKRLHSFCLTRELIDLDRSALAKSMEQPQYHVDCERIVKRGVDFAERGRPLRDGVDTLPF